MATVYVSKTETNGYAIGLDTRNYAQSQSKNTPVLTITRALALAVAGDTIMINDGVYTESTYPEINKINLTINAQNDHMVTLRSPGTTFTMIQYATGTGLTLGKIIIDATYTASYCFYQTGAASLTINGTHFINFNSIGFRVAGTTGLTMAGGWLIESSLSASAGIVGINCTIAAAGTVNISSGTITLVSASGSVLASSLTASAVGCALDYHDVIISLSANTASKAVTGISVSAFTEIEIKRNTINELTLQTVAYSSIFIPNTAITTTKCWVYDNIINGGNPNPATNGAGLNICIGDDVMSTPTNHDKINDVRVYNNTCSNMNHQIFLGWITGGAVYGNKCVNGAIGVIGKKTTNCNFHDNLLIGIMGGGALRSKAGNGDVYHNNTAIMTAQSTVSGVGIMATDSSMNVVFKNNIVYMSDVSAICASVLDTASATFSNNDYFAVSDFASNPFSYGGTSYATHALWAAAHEATAHNVDPTFVYDIPRVIGFEKRIRRAILWSKLKAM